MYKSLISSLALTLTLLTPSFSGEQQERGGPFTWSGLGLTPVWSDAANWDQGPSPAVAPPGIGGQAGAFVTIDGGATPFTVVLDMDVDLGGLTVGGSGPATQTLNNSGFLIESTGLDMVGTSGVLNITASGAYRTTGTNRGKGFSGLTNNGQVLFDNASVNREISNNGMITVTGTTVFDMAVTNEMGATLIIEGATTSANVTMNAGLSNFSQLTLKSDTLSSDVLLNVGMTLTNQGTGTITSSGSLGMRRLDAELNQFGGTVQVDYPLTIGKAGASHSQGANINIDGVELKLDLSGGGNWMMGSTSAFSMSNGGFLSVENGAFFSDGLISATGGVGVQEAVFDNVTLSGNLNINSGIDMLFRNVALAPLSNVNNNGTLSCNLFNTVDGMASISNNAGASLQIVGTGGEARLDFPSSWVNDGALVLDSLDGSNAVLSVGTGFLNNDTINTTSPGMGGERRIEAELTNAGTGSIFVGAGLILDKMDAAHANNGLINVNQGNMDVMQSGSTPGFNNDGPISIGTPYTFHVTNGTYAHGTSGSISTIAFGRPPVTPEASFENVVFPAGNPIDNDVVMFLINCTIDAGATVDNKAFLDVLGSLVLNGTLLNTSPGAQVKLLGSSFGDADLQIFGSFDNNGGTLKLISEQSGARGVVTPNNGVFSNPSMGIIRSESADVPNAIMAEFQNAGLVVVDSTLELPSGGNHVNTGTIDLNSGTLYVVQLSTGDSFSNQNTINIAAGSSFQVDGGIFDANTGAINNSATPLLPLGSIALLDGLILEGTTIQGVLANNGTLHLTNTQVDGTLSNTGTILAHGANGINGTLNNSTGLVSVKGLGGPSVLTLAMNTTNNGQLHFDSDDGSDATIVLTGGNTLTNNGTIEAVDGAGGIYELDGVLNNSGNVIIGRTLELSLLTANHANSGTISLILGDLNVQLGAGSFTNSGTLEIQPFNTMAINGGTFSPNVGLINEGLPSRGKRTVDSVLALNSTIVDNGTLANNGVKVMALNTSFNANTNLIVQGLFEARSGNTFAGTVSVDPMGEFAVVGDMVDGPASTTMANTLNNQGIVRLDTNASSANAVLNCAQFNNMGAGQFFSVGDTVSLAHELRCQLLNDGAMSIDHDLDLIGANASHTNNGLITLDMNRTLRVEDTPGAPGTFSNFGPITIPNNADLTMDLVDFINENMSLIIFGTISGTGSIDVTNGSFTNNGLMFPGASPGTLNILGDFTNGPDGSLGMELEGLMPVEYDSLAVTGTANLDGILDIIIASPFPLTGGDAFTVMSYGNLNGDFGTFVGTNTIPGFELVPTPDPTDYLLVAQPTDIHWTGITSTDWNDPTNWSPNGTPGPGSTVFIDEPGTYNVDLSSAVTVGAIFLGDPSSNPTLNSNGFDITLLGPIQVQAGATLNLNASSLIDGGGATDRRRGPILLGLDNLGTLNLEGTCQIGLFVANSNTINITGSTSADANVNMLGIVNGSGATLELTSSTSGDVLLFFGGSLTNDGSIFIRQGAGGSRFFGGSLLNNNELVVEADFDVDPLAIFIPLRGKAFLHSSEETVARYSFDDLEDGIVRDDSGNERHLSLGSMTTQAGAFGQALGLNGIDDVLESEGLGEALMARDAWSIEYLTKANQTSGVTISMVAPDQRLETTVLGAADSVWHYHVQTWDGSMWRSYRDGHLLETQPYLPLLSGVSPRLVIGRNGSSYSDGLIDELKLSGSAHDDTQIEETWLALSGLINTHDAVDERLPRAFWLDGRPVTLINRVGEDSVVYAPGLVPDEIKKVSYLTYGGEKVFLANASLEHLSGSLWRIHDDSGTIIDNEADSDTKPLGPASGIDNLGLFVLANSSTLSLDNGDFNNLAGAQITGTGTLDMNFNLFDCAGDLLPGTSPGSIRIIGDATFQPSFQALLEAGGPLPGTDHDQIIVTGNATLNGSVEVVLINGYTGSGGDAIPVFLWGSSSGAFTSLTPPLPQAGLTYALNTQPGALNLDINSLGPIVGPQVFVTDMATDLLFGVDAANGTLNGVVATGAVPENPGVANNGDLVIVPSSEEGTLTVVDPIFKLELGTITGLSTPTSAAITPAGDMAWVTDFVAASEKRGTTPGVYIVDIQGGTIVNTLSGFAAPLVNVVHNPFNNQSYVVGSSGEIMAFHTISHTPGSGLTIAASLTDAVLSPDGSNLYLADQTGNVVVVSTATTTVVNFIPVSGNPSGMDITDDGTLLFVTNGTSDLVRVDLAFGTTTNIDLGAVSPQDVPGALLTRDVAVVSAVDRAYVTAGGGDTLHVVQISNSSILAPVVFRGAAFDHIATNKIAGVAPPTFLFSMPTYQVREDGEQVDITITRMGDTSTEVFVQFDTVDGSALGNLDFTPVSAEISFPIGSNSQTVSVPILDDVVIEGTETFSVILTPAGVRGGAVILDTASVDILDWEKGTLGFSAATYTGLESDPEILVTLTRSNGTDGNISVDVNVTGGTASNGSDYNFSGETVLFADGQATATLAIPLLDDNLEESDETIELALQNPMGGATLDPMADTATVIIEDFEEGFIAFRSATYQVNESKGPAAIELERTGGSDGILTINFDTSDGTANAGTDYTAVNMAITFANGQVAQTVEIPIIDDTDLEGLETVNLTLTVPEGLRGGLIVNATLEIIDDELPPNPGEIQFTSPSYQAVEGEDIVAVLERVNGSAGALMVEVATTPLTATANVDYTPVMLTVTFQDGEVGPVAVPVTTIQDTEFEGNETFQIGLASVGTSSLGTNQTAIMTIIDDDASPDPGTLRFDSIRTTVNEPGTAVLEIERIGGAGGEVSVTVTTSDDTATQGMDYSGGSFTVTFPDGDSEPKSLSITILDDNIAEDLERFRATLSNPTGGATLGLLSETEVVIIDDDRRTVKWLERVLTRTESSMSRVIQASLDNVAPAETIVNIAPGGSATLGVDYTLSSNQLVFPPNTTVASVTLTLIDDNLSETTETAELHLSGGNANIGLPSKYTLTILDNDEVRVNFSSAPAAILEGTGTNKADVAITVEASLTSASTEPLTVDYQVSGGATLGTDHDLTNGTLDFPAGSTTASLTFTLLDDSIEESTEDIIISLQANDKVGLGVQNEVRILVRDDDEALISWVSAEQEVIEDDTGKRAQTLSVFAEMSNPVDRAIYVPFNVAGGATFGEDHDLESGNLFFPQGSTQALITFNVLGDTIQEHNEHVILSLGSGKTRAGAIRHHRVLIRDNDAGQAPNTRIVSPVNGERYVAGQELLHMAEAIGSQGVAPFSYTWEICRSEGTDCEQYESAEFMHSYPAGVYLLRCFAEDADGNTDLTPAFARIRIDERSRPIAEIVDPETEVPVATFIQLPIGTTESFLGKTNDPEAKAPFNTEWHFQSDPDNPTSGSLFTYTFDQAGTFNLIFRAETTDGAVAMDHVVVQVYEGNMPARLLIRKPLADETFMVGQEIEFLAEITEEPGKKTDLEYFWHFRDGAGSGMGGPNPTHAYNNSGLKLVEVVARNEEEGIHLTATVPIHIQSTQAPLVQINLPTDLVLQPGSTGKKDCSASTYLSALILDNKGHRNLSFFWVITRDDEPIESYHETPGRVCFEPGEYTVTLFAVTESGAQSEVAIRTISVKDTSDEDFEPNDSMAEATVPLVPGNYDEMSLDGDLDYYRIVIDAADQRLLFKADIVDGALLMNVLDEQGVALFAEDRLITGSGNVQLPGLDPGVYFIRLQEAGPGKRAGLSFSLGVSVLNPSLFLPGIRVDTDFDSQVGIVNTSNSESSCEAIGYDLDGNIVAEVPFNLTAQGRGHFSVRDLFGDNAEEVAWVQIDSTNAIIGYSRSEGLDDKEVYAVSGNTKLSSELYVPHIAANVDQWFTRAAVVNGADQITNSSIETPGQQADLLLGKGFAQDSFDFVERFGGVLEKETDWATFSDHDGNATMAGVEVFGTKDGSRVVAGLALADARKENPNFTYIANNLYFTHIARNPAFYTGIALVNLGASAQGARIIAYGTDGSKVGEAVRNMGPNEKIVEIAETFLAEIGSPEDIDWVLVEADEDIVGFELFGTDDGLTLAGLEASSALSKNLCYPFLDRDDDVAHGISVVNVNPEPVTVTFKLFDNDGTMIADEVTADLKANEKFTSVITDLFPKDAIFFNEIPGWLEVSADLPLAGFELFINTKTGEEMGAIVAQ